MNGGTIGRCFWRKEKQVATLYSPGQAGAQRAAPLHDGRWRSSAGGSGSTDCGLAEAGPIVGYDDRVGGIGGVVLDAGGLAGDEAFEFDLTFETGDVLSSVIGHTRNGVAVGNQVAGAIVDNRGRA